MDVDSPSPWIAGVAIAVAAVLMAFAAAAETAIERANDVRIRALANQGDLRAKRIASNVGQPATYLGSLTLARIISSGVVFIGFAFIGSEVDGSAGTIEFGLLGAFVVLIVQMTVGIIAARRPEQTALQLSAIVRIYGRVFWLPALIFGLPARLAARSVMAVTPDHQRDLLSLVEEEEAQGGVEEEERQMIRRIIALEDKTVREIMIPRIDIVAVDIDDTLQAVVEVINERGFSRLPVYRERIDDIAGVVYAKDLLRAMANGGRNKPLKDLLRPAEFVPESVRLDNLLPQMRLLRTHMVMVADEYGGVAGLVTIEDLLEEIVGEIEDEYDVARPEREIVSANEVILDAREPTSLLREMFDIDAESEDYDTVGGFVIHHLGRLPTVGDEIAVDGVRLRVLSMAGRRVKRLRIIREERIPEAVGGR